MTPLRTTAAALLALAASGLPAAAQLDAGPQPSWQDSFNADAGPRPGGDTGVGSTIGPGQIDANDAQPWAGMSPGGRWETYEEVVVRLRGLDDGTTAPAEALRALGEDAEVRTVRLSELRGTPQGDRAGLREALAARKEAVAAIRAAISDTPPLRRAVEEAGATPDDVVAWSIGEHDTVRLAIDGDG